MKRLTETYQACALVLISVNYLIISLNFNYYDITMSNSNILVAFAILESYLHGRW